MQSMELPLVLFTVLSQAAIGLTFMKVAQLVTGTVDNKDSHREWRMIAGLMLVGLIASIFHLGHPFEAPTALRHLDKAWLSREVLFSGAFAGLALLGFFLSGRASRPALSWAGAALGLVAVLSAGMTYAPPALPALNNALPAAFFLITSVLLGAGFASWFAGDKSRKMLSRIFTVTLFVALVLNLVVPCVWLSGSTVMSMTGTAWLASPFYWIHLAVLAIALLVNGRTAYLPIWLPPFVLFGELVGRAGFFTDTIHTAANMGGLY